MNIWSCLPLLSNVALTVMDAMDTAVTFLGRGAAVVGRVWRSVSWFPGTRHPLQRRASGKVHCHRGVRDRGGRT